MSDTGSVTYEQFYNQQTVVEKEMTKIMSDLRLKAYSENLPYFVPNKTGNEDTVILPYLFDFFKRLPGAEGKLRM